MSNPALVGRRHALKMLVSAPLLPLGSLSITSLLTGCGGDSIIPEVIPSVPAVSFSSATFSSMPAPSLANPVAMATTLVGSTLNVTMSDKSVKSYKLAYQTYFITGDMVDDGKGGKILAGWYYNILNKPIFDISIPGKERQIFSDSPDGTSLFTVPNANVSGVKGKPVFSVIRFEYTSMNQAGVDTYGQLPSPITVLSLDQDQSTGKFSLVKYHNIDTSKVYGLWITCGSGVSPWGTHLSSENSNRMHFQRMIYN